MSPEQHHIYLRTYEMALSKLALTCEFDSAVKQASEHAHEAVRLYESAETAKRGPGRPPKESKA